MFISPLNLFAARIPTPNYNFLFVNCFRFFLIVHADRGFIENGVFNHRLFNLSFTIMTVMFGLFGYLPYVIGGIVKPDYPSNLPIVSNTENIYFWFFIFFKLLNSRVDFAKVWRLTGTSKK